MEHAVECHQYPTFIGIGAEKCATDWCWACLEEHPAVSMARPKELNYFSLKYDYGMRWYMSHFNDRTKRICGEISPSYMDCEEACARIAQDFPQISILAVLRNPYDRAMSHLLMDIRARRGAISDVQLDTARAIAQADEKYVRRSLYFRALLPYFRTFPRDRIRILFYDSLVDNPNSFVRSLYRAVGVEDLDFIPSVLNERLNSAGDYRWPGAIKTLRFLAHKAKSHNLTRPILNWAHSSGLSEFVVQLLSKNNGRPDFLFDDVFGRSSRDTVYRDMQALRSELKLDIPLGWRVG